MYLLVGNSQSAAVFSVDNRAYRAGSNGEVVETRKKTTITNGKGVQFRRRAPTLVDAVHGSILNGQPTRKGTTSRGLGDLGEAGTTEIEGGDMAVIGGGEKASGRCAASKGEGARSDGSSVEHDDLCCL